MEALRHFRSREGLLDIALSVVLVGLGLAATLSEATVDGQEVVFWRGFLWILLFIPPAAVAFRRIYPVPALVVAAIGTAVIWGSGYPDSAMTAVVAIYSAVTHGPPRIGMRAAITAAVGLTVFTLLGAVVDDLPFFYVGLVGVSCVAAVALGAHSAARQNYLREVLQRAAESEEHRAVSEVAIVSRERNRIARELHDVVAHGLSVIVVQNSAAQRVLESDPEAARQAMKESERVARESLQEMRQVLGVLRSDEDEPLRPTPGLQAIEELIHDFEASDLDVSLELGLPLGENGTITSGNTTLDTTAYRIVQESLTNVLKHGGQGVRAWVTIERMPDHLDIVVADNGRGLSAPHSAVGHGLRGMRERVELFGGSLRTGGRRGGGFEVRARLPVGTATS